MFFFVQRVHCGPAAMSPCFVITEASSLRCRIKYARARGKLCPLLNGEIVVEYSVAPKEKQVLLVLETRCPSRRGPGKTWSTNFNSLFFFIEDKRRRRVCRISGTPVFFCAGGVRAVTNLPLVKKRKKKDCSSSQLHLWLSNYGCNLKKRNKEFFSCRFILPVRVNNKNINTNMSTPLATLYLTTCVRQP